jgi:hypothetical protein
MPDSSRAALAACAHLRVSYRTEPCDGLNVRGERVANLGTHGWWECDSGCGTKFGPVTVAPAAGEPAPPTSFVRQVIDSLVPRPPYNAIEVTCHNCKATVRVPVARPQQPRGVP